MESHMSKLLNLPTVLQMCGCTKSDKFPMYWLKTSKYKAQRPTTKWSMLRLRVFDVHFLERYLFQDTKENQNDNKRSTSPDGNRSRINQSVKIKVGYEKIKVLVSMRHLAIEAAMILGVCQLLVVQSSESNVQAEARQAKITCLLVFGDSSVDPGNNNHLATDFKANFLPYGKNYLYGKPTGRFSNGRLPTDFIAEALGIGTAVPAFLDPALTSERLLHGASFASASSGYDDLTAESARVIPIYKQIEYLGHYKMHLRNLVGERKEEEIIKKAIFVMSAGTNDFLQNYYLLPNRSQQFKEQEYENYLIASLIKDVKEMYRHGARRFVLVGLPPIGSLPIIMTLAGQTDCVDQYNQVAVSFNSKVKDHLEKLKMSLGIKAVYADIYQVWMDAMKKPAKYGFVETEKGCCGSGTTEVGEICMGQKTCEDPEKYLYWDAVHPSERMYYV